RKLALDGFHIFSKWVDGHRDIFSCVKPNAGVIALLRHGLPMKSFDICERLFKEKSVGVVPGEVFDLENYLRICFCLEEEKLNEALGLVDGFLEQIVPMVRRQRRKPRRNAS
ncbi:MAG: aminotransferase class I/II-fold pyridoxal phosphate-dependent enzyme, partial [Candidatus Geothermarchaeales archaeon]